ncbi:metallophosphoesterase family protein [Sphingobacterium pedocola]|uniref:PhoD-like phosphatase metallophosphatase domain-containing protein n=1 Tax=Sphingobacterium pedocola TaxID=2082722 RepID=A0ABR9T7D9_9SPHI|nr:hypothetical protein [Sphingobacterium pedocola]MBE8721258.1 hypothetical protein [Sphingobacterium pedocola]
MGLQFFAGPLLRRVSPKKVIIWAATIGYPSISGKLHIDGQSIAEGYSKSISIQDKIFIHLIEIEPGAANALYTTAARQAIQSLLGNSFPTNKVISYSVGIPDGDIYNYTEFNQIVIDQKLAYGNEDLYPSDTPAIKDLTNQLPKLPCFIIPSTNQQLNIAFGSCRKPHDKGADAFEHIDRNLKNSYTDVMKRPHVLYMGGDQIYADDVDDSVIHAIKSMSKKYGLEEILPSTNIPTDQLGDRSKFINKIGFTTGEGKNHLLSLGDYLAMYGLVWNAENWKGLEGIPDFSQGLISVRRVLANTPTYMIFDDHDVTDDWCITNERKQKILEHITGKRIIANALAAYFLFQGWGNDPQKFDYTKIKKAIENRKSSTTAYDSLFMHQDWEFEAPTVPVSYFLDTRTNRGGTGFPTLLKSIDSWQRTQIHVTNKNLPFVLITPGPMVTFRGIDRLQEDVSKWPDNPVVGLMGKYGADYESWSSNPINYKLFFSYFKQKNITKIVVLSGDVHYGFSAVFSIFDKKAMLDIPNGYKLKGLQITSSAFKNSASILGWFSQNGYRGNIYLLIFKDRSSYAFDEDNNKSFIHSKKPRLIINGSKIKQLIGNNTDSLYEDLSEDLYPELIMEVKINSAIPKTAEYIAEHNYGLMNINQNQIHYSFNNGGKYSFNL